MSYPWKSFLRFYRRKSAGIVFRNLQTLHLKQPLVSFTFDDFPRSALLSGGEILKRFGAAGTYYTALGLLGKESPSGRICTVNDLQKAIADGHELGCHTFDHYDSWATVPEAYVDSVERNKARISQLLPGVELQSFAYPLSTPHPMIKRAVSNHFLCCRGGGQKINIGKVDMNQLSSFFLEKAQNDIGLVRAIIDKSVNARGWLIFATHEVSNNPSPYGCTPEFFEKAVKYAAEAGARIVPIGRALDIIRGDIL